MPVNDALLFIDANKYLDLYRIDQGKKLLAPLVEQVDYIFVTQQIFGEVQRNKISAAAEFLKQKSKALKLQTFNLPDHLSSTSINQRNDVLQQFRSISQAIKNVNTEVDTLVLGLIDQISRSEDEVSKSLFKIFSNAISHSPEELQRARERRELGNPPGKSADPIGDQLTWEQILTHFKGKKRLWIISRDSDYATDYGNKSFLNSFLYDELCGIVSEPEIYLFKDIVEGIQHFVDTTGVQAEERLTPQEAEEIEREERSLPSLYQQGETVIQPRENIDFGTLSQIIYQQNEAIRRTVESIDFSAFHQTLNQQGEAMRRTLENMDFSAFHQALNQQNEAMRRTLGSMDFGQLSGIMNRSLPNPHTLSTSKNHSLEEDQEEIKQTQDLSLSQESNYKEKDNEEGAIY